MSKKPKKPIVLNKIPEKCASFIVKSRWIFLGIFIAATVICCGLITQTDVKYDLTGYLPAQSGASQAITLMKEEFDDKGMTYIVVKNVTEDEAQELCDELSEVEGVGAVSYDKSIYYKNGSAMYTVTLSDYDSTESAFATMERLIDSLSGKEAYFTGQSAYSYYTKKETEDSILTIGIVIVIAILLMLLFTSKTYFELLLMVIILGVSVAINMGTNFLFGGISYISNLVGLVLQLALSLDYSVILLHRFSEEKARGLDSKSAAKASLKKGFAEIVSSSLTTIAGLCALMFMTLPIGVEIGLALAKGIVCSLVTVIFLMPALLVICNKPLEKSKHKNFVPNVTKPARATLKARKVIVPLFLVVALLAGVGQGYNTYAFNMNGCADIVESQAAIYDDFGTLNSLVVLVPRGDYDNERAFVEKIKSNPLIDSATSLSTLGYGDVYLTDSMTKEEFSDTLSTLSAGTDFESLASSFGGTVFDAYVKANMQGVENPSVRLVDLLEYVYNHPTYSQLLGGMKDTLGQLVTAKQSLESDDYSRITFNIDAGVEDAATFSLLADMQSGDSEYSVSNYYNEYYMTGESVVCYDMSLYFPRDNTMVSVFIVVFMLIILLFTFRNALLPVVLTLAIQGGIWINFVIPFLGANSVSFIGYLIISAVQMGATIDYAIVLTNRYRTIKQGFADRYDAMAAAENAVFPTIITSGTILTITGFVLGFASSGVVSQLGYLLGIGTAISMGVVLLVLPSMLLLSEKATAKLDFKKIAQFFKPHPVEETPLPDYVVPSSEDDTLDASELYDLLHAGVDINAESNKKLKKRLKNGK